MSWHGYKEIIRIFRSIFPEQTKTPLHILLWCVVLLVDVIICVLEAVHLGIITPDNFQNWMIIPILIAVLILFWIQGVLYGAITKLFKRD